VIQVAALILTFTRAAWIGVVLIGVVFMLTSKPSLEIKGVRLGNRIFIIIMLFAISMLGFIPAVRNRVVSLFEGETGGNSLYLRFYEWKSAFKLFMKNIIFGVGPENVFLEFGKFRDAWLNKSSDWLLRVAYIRNTYLHFLVSTGLLGFGSFVLFVLLSLKNSLQILKCKVDLVTKGLMLGLISWFIVHIFYYPSIVTLLLLTIFMVVLIKRSGDTDNTLTKFVLNNRRLRFVKTGTLLLSSIVLFVYAFNFAKAELYFKKSLRQSDTVQSIRLIDVSIRHKPNEPSYYRQRAYYLSVTLTQGGYYDQDVVIKLVHNLNKAMQLGPDDLNNYDVAANIYYELDQNFPEKGFINKAIDYGEKVVELSPTHSYFYDNLGLYYMEAALYNEAESTFEKAIELKDDQASSYLHLAEIDIHMERYEQAEKRLRKVLQMSSSQKQTCLAASKLKFVLEEKHK
jgi:Tfp pilus assembly protein PilF